MTNGIIVASTPATLRDSLMRAEEHRLYDKFYERFVTSDPRIGPYFLSTDFKKQKNLLKDGVGRALSYAAGDAGSASFIEHQTVAIGDVGRELSATGANREGKVAGTLALVNIDKGRAHAPQIACSQDLCFVAWHGESPPGAQGAAFDAASGKPVWRRTFSPNADFPVVATGSSGAVLAAWLENGKVVAAPLGRAGYAKTAKVGRAQGPQGGHTQAALSLTGGAERGQFFAAWLDMEANQPEPYVARLACP